MSDHPSVLGINSFSREVVADARGIALDTTPINGRRRAQPMRIELASGNHYVARVVDVDLQSAPELEMEIVSQVVQSMVFRLRFRTDAPPASWTWTFTRIEV